jgi:hypothetical protein
MEIDITSIIIAVVGLSTFFVPIAYDKHKKKSQSKQHLSKFMQDAVDQNIQITEYDVWHEKNIIGIDKTSGFVAYRNELSANPETVVIDLSEVQRCRRYKTDRSVIMQGKTVLVTDKVGLLFTFKDQKKADLKLIFYSAVNGTALSVEIPLSEKWSAMINNNLISTNS